MDQNEFSRRLRHLAGAHNHSVDQSLDPHTRILGSLGFARTVRRAQAVTLCVLLGLGSGAILLASELSPTEEWVVALALAAACIRVVRRCPYWTPAGALSDGLLTLSTYKLNDLGSFIKYQRTDMTTVNNTLLSDLCMQVAMDRHRSPIA